MSIPAAQQVTVTVDGEGGPRFVLLGDKSLRPAGEFSAWGVAEKEKSMGRVLRAGDVFAFESGGGPALTGRGADLQRVHRDARAGDGPNTFYEGGSRL